METRWRRKGLGFLEERHENPPFLLADADVSGGFGLKRGQRGRALKLGLIGASPCSVDCGGQSTMAGPPWAPAFAGR